MAGDGSSASSRFKTHTTLSEVEVAAVVTPLLKYLRTLHVDGRAHGNVTFETAARAAKPTDSGSIHCADPEVTLEGSTTAHRSCSVCLPTPGCTGDQTPAADVWSVGVIVLKLLLGRPYHECDLVDKRTGEIPVLPRGTSLECIDFLMDCLAPGVDDRAAVDDLLNHNFLAPPGFSSSADAADLLADSLADVLLISSTHQDPACRPPAVPRLKTNNLVCFTVPSHSGRRCSHCNCHEVEPHRHPAKPTVSPHVVGDVPTRSKSTPTSTAPTKRNLVHTDGASPSPEPKRKCRDRRIGTYICC